MGSRPQQVEDATGRYGNSREWGYNWVYGEAQDLGQITRDADQGIQLRGSRPGLQCGDRFEGLSSQVHYPRDQSIHFGAPFGERGDVWISRGLRFPDAGSSAPRRRRLAMDDSWVVRYVVCSVRYRDIGDAYFFSIFWQSGETAEMGSPIRSLYFLSIAMGNP